MSLRALRCVVGLALASLLPGCTRPSASEQAVCDGVQGVMDELRAGRGDRALQDLATLEERVGGTDNERLRQNGERFFDVVGEEVSDADVTVDEALRRGRRAMLAGAAHLEAMIAECDRLGEEIVLPSYDDEGNRLPPVRNGHGTGVNRSAR